MIVVNDFSDQAFGPFNWPFFVLLPFVSIVLHAVSGHQLVHLLLQFRLPLVDVVAQHVWIGVLDSLLLVFYAFQVFELFGLSKLHCSLGHVGSDWWSDHPQVVLTFVFLRSLAYIVLLSLLVFNLRYLLRPIFLDYSVVVFENDSDLPFVELQLSQILLRVLNLSVDLVELD